MTKNSNLVRALVQLEAQMRQTGLWSDTQPSEQALASQAPFACDQMSFPEWLQFMFIPRLLSIIEKQGDLPENSDITPMAEHFFSQQGLEVPSLIAQIRDIDFLLGPDVTSLPDD